MPTDLLLLVAAAVYGVLYIGLLMRRAAEGEPAADRDERSNEPTDLSLP